MALSKDDLNKIGNLIKVGNEFLDIKWDKRFNQLELKFDEHRIENNKQFKVLGSKIDTLIKTENEDVVAAYNDIVLIKTRLKKAGI